jgi:hypothetical protein
VTLAAMTLVADIYLVAKVGRAKFGRILRITSMYS